LLVVVFNASQPFGVGVGDGAGAAASAQHFGRLGGVGANLVQLLLARRVGLVGHARLQIDDRCVHRQRHRDGALHTLGSPTQQHGRQLHHQRRVAGVAQRTERHAFVVLAQQREQRGVGLARHQRHLPLHPLRQQRRCGRVVADLAQPVVDVPHVAFPAVKPGQLACARRCAAASTTTLLARLAQGLHVFVVGPAKPSEPA